MIQVAMVSRRLKENKTYEDFRKAWYHSVGFGSKNRMFTVVNAFDPREIIVIGLTETTPEKLREQCDIDVNERLMHSLDEVIEPEIERKFGVLVSEDDFSGTGSLDYRPPSVNGKETDMETFAQNLQDVADILREAAQNRDQRDIHDKNVKL